jgi:hypothetical protein
VPEHSWKDLSDVVLMSSRGGLQYDRTFMSSFLRPGLGPQNWVTRCSFPVRGVVQTGPEELSLYVQRDNAQTTSHLRRYTVRLDGFASVHAERQKNGSAHVCQLRPHILFSRLEFDRETDSDGKSLLLNDLR